MLRRNELNRRIMQGNSAARHGRLTPDEKAARARLVALKRQSHVAGQRATDAEIIEAGKAWDAAWAAGAAARAATRASKAGA